jgi:peptidoglycan-associated lipoprotein
MSRRVSSVVLGLLTVLAMSCGKPQYPACEGDADCKDKGEICIDKKCVECNSDAACVKKLGAGATCAQNMCRLPAKPECAGDDDCGVGKKCDANKKCVQIACKQDNECKAGEECFGGFCQARRSADNVSSSCRDPNNPGKVALQSVTFDLDQSDIRSDAQSTLEQNATCLKQAPSQKVVVEGHCDSRGTVEYNLTLGEQRGNAVVKVLDRLGVEKKRLRVVSKGKSEPVCREESDDCYSKNRRVDFK